MTLSKTTLKSKPKPPVPLFNDSSNHLPAPKTLKHTLPNGNANGNGTKARPHDHIRASQLPLRHKPLLGTPAQPEMRTFRKIQADGEECEVGVLKCRKGDGVVSM